MRLRELIKNLGGYRASGTLEDFSVQGISCNSQEIARDFVFVAIKGSRADGNQFIKEAVAKGARVIVSDLPDRACQLPAAILFLRVPDARLAIAKLAAAFYSQAFPKLKVIGITGTNGKTTVTYLLEAILRQAGCQPAVIGTVNYRFDNRVFPSLNTTPGPLKLQSLMARMLKSGTDYLCLEVSSHALEQKRVEGIDFHAGIFTNLTQDHLDYHRNRENYFQAKAKLFKGLKANSLAILNYDDKYALRIRGLTEARPVGYSLEKKSEVMATKIEFGLGGSRFLFYFKGRRLGYIKTSLIGRHNIYNILAAAAFGLSEGIGFSLIQKAVATVGVVPGRLERIVARDGLNIFVDYAHTEDALRNVIQTLREVAGPQSRLLVVFGCGGERDKLKRPKMGRVVSEYADYAIITSDNPRSEEPLAIIEQIKRGITKHNYSVIPSRRQAIRESLRLARPTDMVLVAGKGHEGCQIFKGRIVRFDDRQVVRECLRQVNY